MSCVNECDLRPALLAHYAEREAFCFHQFDVFLGAEPDDVVLTDDDGDAMFRTGSWELCSGVPVRLHVLDGTSKADAVRAVRKVLNWIKRDYPEDGNGAVDVAGDPANKVGMA